MNTPSFLDRRQFLLGSSLGLGAFALPFLDAKGADIGLGQGGMLKGLHHPAKAKRIIYLSMVGAPSQIDLLDHKPMLDKLYDTDLPDSIRQGQRLTGMTSGQSRFPIAPSIFKFSPSGKSGTMFSELIPNMAKMADDLCVIKTMNTEAINHEPAQQLMYTGNMNAGKPSIGAWLSYGLGSMNEDLPTYAVINATHSSPGANVQAISARLWGAGFLPGEHAGVALRSGVDPVLYLQNAPGISPALRRSMLDGLGQMNAQTLADIADPETRVRMKQYEMAFRMQSSVPELTDISKEPAHVLDMYGPDVRKPGTFAASALLARRLVERGTRFVQIFHRGWDQHGNLPRDLRAQCSDVDQAAYALVQDLKQRGMLEDTIVIWGGEFGRTVYSQGGLSKTNYGRDHHPKCFSLWATGGGFKPGLSYGTTDDFSYNIVENPVHIRDFHATILHLFGIDHERLTLKVQGLDARLTGVECSKVIKGVLS